MSSLPLTTSFPVEATLQVKEAVLRKLAASERRINVCPAAQLQVRPKPEMVLTGIPELDLFTGGIPRGCLTELCGPISSGKSSALIASIAAASKRGESCVLIDASDSFDPNSGAAAGVEFNRLLWVRCGRTSDKSWGHSDRSGQVKNSHRSSALKVATSGLSKTENSGSRAANELRLAQVLKSTDLVLQSGGFGLVALDLAGIPDKFVRRIPLASWFRFQRAIERTKTVLLVVSEVPCAQNCAALVLKFEREQPPAINDPQSAKLTHAELLQELKIEAELVRSRLERKPIQSVRTNFKTQAVRAG